MSKKTTKHPDHNPSMGVIVQGDNKASQQREKELADAVKRTEYKAPETPPPPKAAKPKAARKAAPKKAKSAKSAAGTAATTPAAA